MFFYIIHEFSFVFGWISGKNGPKEKNLGNYGGPSQRRRDPLQRRRIPTPQRGREGRLVRPRVRRGEAELHRGEATVNNMKNVVFWFWFCFVIPLLQGLVYWTNEDLISV